MHLSSNDQDSLNPPAVPAAGPVLTQPKFCSGCGATWQAEWSACPDCVARGAPRPVLTGASEGRPIARSLWLYFAWLAISLITAVAGIVSPESDVTFTFIYSILTALIAVGWTLASWSEARSGLTTLPHLKWFGLAVIASIATYTIASGAVRLMGHLFELPMLEYKTPFFTAGYGWTAVIVCICVQPALFEELAFRGVILPAMEKVLTATEAVLVSSLLFMILHLSVPSFPHLLIIGLMLGYLRVRTGSLYPGIVMHFCHNLLCVLSESWDGMFPWS